MPWEICELFLTAQPPLLPPMNFYPPGPTFSSTMVGFNPGSVPTLVPTLSLPAVALDGKSMDVMAPSYQHTDPVTKAVLDNIMGKLPTKKIPVICRCDVCNLEFSGQVVLDTHLAGAKHAKKVKSQEILKILETSGQSFTRDQETKILKCEICEVVVNSSQQLQTHLAGNKHKQRALKKVSSGSLGVGKPVPGNTVSTSIADGVNYTQDVGDNGSTKEDTTSGDSGSGSAGEGPKEADSPRTSKFYCEVCNVSLNSEIQLDQHMTARKHKERESNGGRPKTRPAPYWRRGGHPMRGAKKGPKVPIAMQYSQPLSNNFVSGGAML